MERLLSAREAAQVLGITEARLYALVRQRVLPAVHLGRQVRIHPARLREWLDAGGHRLDGGWRAEADGA